jgi:hypothetical protein
VVVVVVVAMVLLAFEAWETQAAEMVAAPRQRDQKQLLQLQTQAVVVVVLAGQMKALAEMAVPVSSLFVTRQQQAHPHQRLATHRSATQVATRFTLGPHPGRSLFKESTWHISHTSKTVSWIRSS